MFGDPHALRLDLRDGRSDERPFRRPAAHPQRRWIIALAVAAALVACGVLLRDPLADRLWPEARVHALTADAAAALARGHLTAPDGSGARELYEAARAIDPDQAAPRAGLARVAEAALAQAAAGVEAGRFGEAHAHLRLARELSIPRERADAIAIRLREREAALAGLDGLVARADVARADGRLHGDASAALPLYARVLVLEPGRADALRGRDEALAALLEQARADLRRGDLQAAAGGIAAARDYDPGHVDLPDTQARLTEELDALRRRAAVDFAGGRLDAAVATWRRLQAFDPDDAAARDGLQQAAAALASRAQRQGADFRFADAETTLSRARALAPDAAAVVAAQSALERARRRHAQLQASAAGSDRADRVPVLLREAAEAEARGDLLTPPGDSAYDHLRAAQAIAPTDPQVRRAVARLLPSARACFERYLSANDLARARRCLGAREALGDSAVAMAADQRRLAQRWLAIGDERLGAGQLASASAALASAREIDPRAPGIEEFQRRLRVASRE